MTWTGWWHLRLDSTAPLNLHAASPTIAQPWTTSQQPTHQPGNLRWILSTWSSGTNRESNLLERKACPVSNEINLIGYLLIWGDGGLDFCSTKKNVLGLLQPSRWNNNELTTSGWLKDIIDLSGKFCWSANIRGYGTCGSTEQSLLKWFSLVGNIYRRRPRSNHHYSFLSSLPSFLRDLMPSGTPRLRQVSFSPLGLSEIDVPL